MQNTITLYNVVKVFHILAAIAFVGGIFARQAVRALAARSDEITQFATLHHAASHIENLLVKPSSILVFLIGGFGAYLGGLPMGGFLQGADQNWLLVSNALFLGGFSLVPLVFIPQGERFRPILDAAIAQGRMTEALRAALRNPVVRVAHLYEEVSIVVIVVLMVLKPF